MTFLIESFFCVEISYICRRRRKGGWTLAMVKIREIENFLINICSACPVNNSEISCHVNMKFGKTFTNYDIIRRCRNNGGVSTGSNSSNGVFIIPL